MVREVRADPHSRLHRGLPACSAPWLGNRALRVVLLFIVFFCMARAAGDRGPLGFSSPEDVI